ncbi:hypothetical protein AVEN_81082-1 [Araneus ventricosus]|uniref:Uncharacterized protein n=1 Tax=Araneus ventricosus TaxID=182803 RepID=A0A4Y2JTB4_ARAVE|nr:hypothetical protein AVEN_81082-1 [Araneus ventricosus]
MLNRGQMTSAAPAPHLPLQTSLHPRKGHLIFDGFNAHRTRTYSGSSMEPAPLVEEAGYGADVVAIGHQESPILDAGLGAALALEESPVGPLALGTVADAHPGGAAPAAVRKCLHEHNDYEKKCSSVT